jgi:hypothetical protein
MTDGVKLAVPPPSQNVAQLDQGAGVGQQASVPTPAAPAAKADHSAGTSATPAPRHRAALSQNQSFRICRAGRYVISKYLRSTSSRPCSGVLSAP